MVTVGSEIFVVSKDIQTFHQFLFVYIHRVMGEEWFEIELNKTEDLHPLITLYKKVLAFLDKSEQAENPRIMTGAVSAYLALAYNLYTLQHNVEITKRLVQRLRNSSDFKGAFYETFVDALFVKSGFEIELEDESGRSGTTSCEFVATFKETGRKFSVEAKVRDPYKETNNISNQLYKAFQKQAKHERIVFIELNTDGTPEQIKENLLEARTSIRNRESSLTINGESAPPAYVFITNYSYFYHFEDSDFGIAAIPEGFKIDDFKEDFVYQNAQQYVELKQKNKELLKINWGIEKYFIEIPATYDGELPEFVFLQDRPRLLIGNIYLIPDADGELISGILESATVSVESREAWGVYLTPDGRRLIQISPLSDSELLAYAAHPETFFGIKQYIGQKATTHIELFDFMYSVYKDTPREKLLDWLKEAPDFEQLQTKATEELAVILCERAAGSKSINPSSKPHKKLDSQA